MPKQIDRQIADAIADNPHMLPSEGFAARLGITIAQLQERTARGNVLGLDLEGHGTLYPAWQIGASGEVLGQIPAFIEFADDYNIDAYDIYRFLTQACADYGQAPNHEVLRIAGLEEIQAAAQEFFERITEMSWPVCEVTVTVTILLDAVNAREAEAQIEGLSLAEIGDEIDEGGMLGQHRIVSSEIVSADRLHARQCELGNDGSFFPCEQSVEGAADPAGRLLRLQIERGWSAAASEMHMRAFLMETGLADAYAAHVEAKHPVNQADPDPFGGAIPI